MSPKSDTQKEVILEKSPSGTWVVPGNTKVQFQSWQRLWFVIGVIYLLVLAGCYYMLMPSQQSIERTMVFSVIEEVKRYEGMAFAGVSPQMIIEAAGSEGYAAWIAELRTKYRIGPEGAAGFDRIENEYRDALSRLPAKRRLGLLISVVVWMIPMSLLYVIGLIIDWIRRGARAIKER